MLTDKAAESGVHAGQAYLGIDFYQYILCGVDVDLQQTSLVERAVQQHQ